MKVTKDVWVIMDKGHIVIACGQNRGRYVTFVKDALDASGGGIRFYATESKARTGYKVSQFYLGNYGSPEKAAVNQYMEDTYGEDRESHDKTRTYRHVDQYSKYDQIYEPVKVTLTIEVPEPTNE